MKLLLKSLILVSLIATLCTTAAQPNQPKAKIEAKNTNTTKVALAPKGAKAAAKSAPKAAPVKSSVAQPPKVPPSPAPIRYAGTCQSYMPLIRKYNWDVRVASAIMQAESRCNASAISPLNYDGLRDYGLFQIHGVAVLDPAANVAYAYYHKYLQSGWYPWTTYTSGRYLQYL
jgi:soluble lytic murein transglycosylase-like protein